MQGLQSDQMGFLVGKPIDLTDLHDELVQIVDELGEIKGLLSKDKPIALTADSISRLVSGINTSTANGQLPTVATPRIAVPVRQSPKGQASEAPKSNRDLERSIERLAAASKPNSSKVVESITTKVKETLSSPTVAIPRSRNAQGQFVGASDGKDDSKRDEKGRFISQNKVKDNENKDAIPSKIGAIGKNIVGSISELAQPRDEADPSVQAMSEVTGVLTPVGRGLGKVFTTSNSGVSRGQDRWYRRFFKQGSERSRVDDIANKREQQLLRNIEKKEGADSSSSSGFLATLLLAFMGGLATLLLKGFQTLATPLRFLGVFFAPLLKVLQALTRAIGLGKLADKLGSPNRKGSKLPSSISEKGATGAKTGTKSATKGVFKKIPIIGSLITAGLLAKDLNDISHNDETKETKTKQVGSAVGSSVGGLGGMVAGGATGAAIGSVVPVVGTLAGGIIGSILGGMGGDKVGGILGDKFGDWVNDLRASGFIDKMSRDWQIGINAMGIMWRDFSTLAGSIWGGMVAGVQSGWSNVTGFTQLMWNGVGNSFTATTDFLKSSWAVATAVIGGALNSVWGSLGTMATAISDSVKAYTGLDLAKNFNDLRNTVGGWVDGLKTTVSGVSSSLKDSLSNWAGNLFNGYFGDVFSQAAGMVDNSNEAASTTKEQDANQTAVLNAFLKAGFSKNQAIALTAEVGRENNYNSKNLYGYHKDAANGAINMGMISWQGDRAKRLQAYMQERGLIKNGKMVRSQAALDAQAEFVKQEINSGNYDATKRLFEQKDLNPEAYAKTLGTDYVKWAYGQDVLSSGKRFDWKKHNNVRRGHMQTAQAKTNVSIPYRRGYTPPVNQAKSKANSQSSPQDIDVKNQSTTADTLSPASDAVDPKSIEGMMQTFNNFDGMGIVKEAVITMLKNNAEGKAHAKPHIRNTAAVPAVRVPNAAQIAEAPKVTMPIVSTTNQDSNSSLEDVPRDVSNGRIAHIVTGGHAKY